MAKKNVYAVRKGRTEGLFYTWEECQASITGYSGAEFKGFSTEEEAKAYLEGDEAGNIEASAPEAVLEAAPEGLIAYVDGSFDEAIGRYSFGCIILTPDGEIIRESGCGADSESLLLRNVAGEIMGAMNAVRWALENGYASLDLRYDYQGIEKWATGGWNAYRILTQKYAEYMKEKQKHLNITFTKVKAHSGDFFNEEADKLAKAALKDKK